MLWIMISLALAMCLLQPAAADGIGGWPLLHWGMTRQQVERAYPNFEEFDKDKFGLKSYIAGDCEFTMDLGFYDNQLQQVHLEAAHKKGGSQPCRTIKDALVRKYGLPTPDNTGAVTWTKGETHVTYRSNDDDKNSQYVFIIVDYMNDRAVLEWIRKQREDRL